MTLESSKVRSGETFNPIVKHSRHLTRRAKHLHRGYLSERRNVVKLERAHLCDSLHTCRVFSARALTSPPAAVLLSVKRHITPWHRK